MAEFVNIKTELDQAMALLSELDGNKDRMRRRILSGVGTAVKNRVKKKYKTFLHKQTGTLYKSLRSKIIKSGKAVIVSPAADRSGVRYGYVLAKGTTLKAKNKDFLTFRIGDKWIRKKEIKIPERDWVTGPAESYLTGADFRVQLEKLVQHEIERAQKSAEKYNGASNEKST